MFLVSPAIVEYNYIFYIVGSVLLLLSIWCTYLAVKATKNRTSNNVTNYYGEFKRFWYKNRLAIWSMLAVICLLSGGAMIVLPLA